MKKCNYRKCQNIIEGRKNKKYCCRSCKEGEREYRKRVQKWYENQLEDWKREEMIEQYIKNNFE